MTRRHPKTLGAECAFRQTRGIVLPAIADGRLFEGHCRAPPLSGRPRCRGLYRRFRHTVVVLARGPRAKTEPVRPTAVEKIPTNRRRCRVMKQIPCAHKPTGSARSGNQIPGPTKKRERARDGLVSIFSVREKTGSPVPEYNLYILLANCIERWMARLPPPRNFSTNIT